MRYSLRAARTVRVRDVAMLALILTLAGSCETPTNPPPTPPPTTASVRFAVTFATTPLALASIVATLTPTSSGIPTVAIDLTPVPGTDSRQWTGGPVTIGAGTYAMDIQGKDASDVVTYRGSGTLTIQNGESRTFAFALVCVSSACQGVGTVALFVLTPELEVEPNDASSAATPLAIASLFGGQLEMGAANGTINPASDLDYFSLPFSAVAPGDTIVVQVYGTRFGSSLLAAAALFDPFGVQLAEVDYSSFGGDPIIRFTVPSSAPAGSYQVRVRSSGVYSTTGPYTMWAYHCRSGGVNSVRCLDPSGTPALGGVDIVFIQDMSSSMGAEINGVKNSVLAFAEDLKARGLNARIGAVGYSGPGTIPSSPAGSPCEFLGPVQDLTTPDAFEAAVASTWVATGGCDTPENGLEAIEYAHTHMSWRAGVGRRFYIDITDTGHHVAGQDCDGVGPCTDETLASIVALLASSAVIHVVAPASEAARTVDGGLDPYLLADATGGRKFDLGSGNVDLVSLGISATIHRDVLLSLGKGDQR